MADIDVTTRRRDRRLIFGGGAIAGVIGGIVVSLFMLSMGAARGQNLWVGAKTAAYPFLGDRVMAPGFDAGAVALGLIGHFAVSIVWGILFALVAFGLSRWATIGTSALWGIVVWLAMFYVVLPVVGVGGLVRGMPLGAAIFEHVIFGVAVGVGFLPFQRTRPERLLGKRRLRPA